MLCLVLAIWQWQRGVSANERNILQQEKNAFSPVALPFVPEEYQRVLVAGSVVDWYLLDNRTRHGVPGREVLVDIEIPESDVPYDRVLINIGWQPRVEGLIPTYEIPKWIAIDGMTKFPSEGFMLQDAKLDPAWPELLQHIEISLLEDHRGLRYYPAVVYSTVKISDWPLPIVHFKNKYHMHLGYALQWALIGIACLILFIKISISRVKNENQQELAT